jgi:hypothetical protein
VDQNTGVDTVTPNSGFTGTINLLVGVSDQVNRSGATTLDDPSNYNSQQITLTVTSNSTPVNLPPIAIPATVSTSNHSPKTIQLTGNTASPASSQTLTYALVGQPSHGTITQFDPNKGTLVYTPSPIFTGTDKFQFTVTDVGVPIPNLTSDPSTITILAESTGAVRTIGNVLVVTPPVTDAAKANTILVKQVNNATDPTPDMVQVVYNGIIDRNNQPLVSNVDRIVVYETKANDTVTIDPSVDSTIPVTLNGGHGGHNTLQAGAGPTREHGWFGHNTLIGGTGTNELIGRAGHVKFKPSSATDVIFAGTARPNFRNGHIRPPGGTFYKFVNGKLIPTNAAGTGDTQGTGPKTIPKKPHPSQKKK